MKMQDFLNKNQKSSVLFKDSGEYYCSDSNKLNLRR